MTPRWVLSCILGAATSSLGSEANLSSFKPAGGMDGIVAVEGARRWESASPIDLKLPVDYGRNPMSRPGLGVIEYRTGMWLSAELHVIEPLTLAVQVPFTVQERGLLAGVGAVADGAHQPPVGRILAEKAAAERALAERRAAKEAARLAAIKEAADKAAAEEAARDSDGDTGNVLTNMVLSQARAEAVTNYLIEKGIAPERLQAKGFGRSQPAADNATPAGRVANRRVEFKMLASAEAY